MIEKLVVLIEIAGCTSTKYSLTFSRYLQLSQNIINHFQRKSKLNKNNKMKILLFADDNFMKTIKKLKVKTVITGENECDLFTLGRPARLPLLRFIFHFNEDKLSYESSYLFSFLITILIVASDWKIGKKVWVILKSLNHYRLSQDRLGLPHSKALSATCWLETWYCYTASTNRPENSGTPHGK